MPKLPLTQATFILTVLGDDKPGLVGELSAVIGAHQGNWLESSLAHLAGKFAGIVKVDVPGGKAAALQKALGLIEGLRVTCEAAAAGSPPAARRSRRLKLALVGHDRLGIVREVSSVLAHYAVNVESLETHTASAPMSADVLFHATADLTADQNLDAAALTAELERISNDLMVDITLDETLN